MISSFRLTQVISLLQTANEMKTYIFNYCTQNDNIQQNEMVDILNEIIDEEFDTICEDNSTIGKCTVETKLIYFGQEIQIEIFIQQFTELSEKLVIYLKLCLDGKFDEIRQHLSQLPKCVNWLDSSFKIVPVPKDDDDSDSMSDDDSEDEDMDMSNDEAPALVEQRNQRNRPQTDEDGWTTIPSRRR